MRCFRDTISIPQPKMLRAEAARVSAPLCQQAFARGASSCSGLFRSVGSYVVEVPNGLPADRLVPVFRLYPIIQNLLLTASPEG